MTAPSKIIAGLLLAVCSATIRAENKLDKLAPLRVRLQAAAAQSSLDTPGLAPWHLKLDVQLFDDKGSPTDKGTIETWWINPTDVQTTYAFPAYTATEVLSPTGTRRTKAAGLPPDAIRVLLNQVIHPMPDNADIDQATPDLRKQAFSKVPLECIMLNQPILNHSFPPIEPPLGLFPTFCFDPGQERLRLSYDYGSELTIRNAIGKFQSRQVATSISLRENGLEAASAHIATLQSNTALQAPEVDEATLELPASPAMLAASVMAGMLLARPNPIYPEAAKQRHASGDVVIHAIIGRDGHIRSMRLVKVPDADLAIAAMTAVRGWVYKPYLLNGQPTESKLPSRSTSDSANHNSGERVCRMNLAYHVPRILSRILLSVGRSHRVPYAVMFAKPCRLQAGLIFKPGNPGVLLFVVAMKHQNVVMELASERNHLGADARYFCVKLGAETSHLPAKLRPKTSHLPAKLVAKADHLSAQADFQRRNACVQPAYVVPIEQNADQNHQGWKHGRDKGYQCLFHRPLDRSRLGEKIS